MFVICIKNLFIVKWQRKRVKVKGYSLAHCNIFRRSVNKDTTVSKIINKCFY